MASATGEGKAGPAGTEPETAEPPDRVNRGPGGDPVGDPAPEGVPLEAAGGFEPEPARAALVAHAVPGGQRFDPDTGAYSRLLTVRGVSRLVAVSLTRSGVLLRTDAGPEELPEIRSAVRFWFDLDRDLAPVVRQLSRDRFLRPIVGSRPALRVTRNPEGFEAAISTVLGQQVSVARGRTFGARLLDLCGGTEQGGLIAFPSPEVLAGQPFERLRFAVGLTGARARTVLAVARLFADGFRLGPESDPAEARGRLLEVPGVGPWTADYLALRVIGDPDAFPAGDAVLRRALGGATERQAARRAAAWSPWRSYAAVHLWAHAVYH